MGNVLSAAFLLYYSRELFFCVNALKKIGFMKQKAVREQSSVFCIKGDFIMSLLKITQLSHSFGDQVLYCNGEFSLNKGEHMGIVGQNGAGKSTLIKICTGKVIPDSGHISWKPNLTAGCLDQYANVEKQISMEQFLKAAFANLYETERKMNTYYELAAAGQERFLDCAASCQEQLERNDFYRIDTKIAQVAEGLGLIDVGLNQLMGQMSGGQRAKAILAKLLLEKPDVMLLDEPTNFLDKDHITWLADYLSNSESTFAVVSHDCDFLEKISNVICHIDQRKLKKYYGTYSDFLKKEAFLREDYMRKYSAQQRQIKKTEEFIRKNIAGRKTKMAQGRRKQLNRMVRLKALEEKEGTPDFQFSTLYHSAGEILRAEHLTIGYQQPLLSNISFTMKGGQKMAISGFNGIGKSTLIKTLVGQLAPLQGSAAFASQIKIGYFDQELSWKRGTKTPIELISDYKPELTERELRRNLDRCGISRQHAAQSIETLSGGEQAKVKLCLLTLNPHDFLIMDEPTNHLDNGAKDALKTALVEFKGAVLLVSHEESFYKDWISDILELKK